MANLDNNDKIFGKFELWHLLAALVGANIVILFLPYLITNYNFGLNVNFDNNIGATLDGTMSPFIAMIASFLTFIAFWVQYKANQEQRKQFKVQNEDMLFFRMVDTKQSIINNSTTYIENTNSQLQGFQLLEHIVMELKNKMELCSRDLARKYVINNYKNMPIVAYNKMFIAANIAPSEHLEMKNKFISDMDALNFNDKYDYIKEYFGTVGYENSSQIEALESIGSVMFYKTNYNDRSFYYSTSFEDVDSNYKSFLDSYFKNAEYLTQTIDNSTNKDVYLQYYKYNITDYEKIIIFYYLASKASSLDYMKFIINNNLLQGLYKVSSLLLDMPGYQDINAEIEHIKNSYSQDLL